jgi:hypothetical protein
VLPQQIAAVERYHRQRTLLYLRKYIENMDAEALTLLVATSPGKNGHYSHFIVLIQLITNVYECI